jgi:hypothetical protein
VGGFCAIVTPSDDKEVYIDFLLTNRHYWTCMPSGFSFPTIQMANTLARAVSDFALCGWSWCECIKAGVWCQGADVDHEAGSTVERAALAITRRDSAQGSDSAIGVTKLR